MNLFVTAALLCALAVVLLGPVSTALAGARWVTHAPRAAVALWQAIGMAAALAAIGAGLAMAVERFHAGFAAGLIDLLRGAVDGHPLRGLGLPDALGLTLAADLIFVMAFMLAAVTLRTVRARSHHRSLLDLLAGTAAGAAGTVMLDHPAAVAYCLPGIRPRIVISAGTVRLLNHHELAAVIGHERGHANEHHGLVMLPMTGLRNLFRWIPYANLAPRSVGMLLELAADDYAAREHAPSALATALILMADAGHTPSCAFSLASDLVPLRVHRLMSPDRTMKSRAVVSGLLATAAVAAPLSLLFLS